MSIVFYRFLAHPARIVTFRQMVKVQHFWFRLHIQGYGNGIYVMAIAICN